MGCATWAQRRSAENLLLGLDVRTLLQEVLGRRRLIATSRNVKRGTFLHGGNKEIQVT
jgi:hypothetical protein